MERCPHGCGNEWHESELTNTVAGFFRHHRFDKDYDPEADDSGVACIGSLTQGPSRPVPSYYYPPASPGWVNLGTIQGESFKVNGGKSPNWLDDFTSVAVKWWMSDVISIQWDLTAGQGSLLNDWFGELQWNPPCKQEPVDGNLPKVDVKFGPENWINTEPRQLGYAKQYIPLPKLAEWRAIPLPTFKSKDLSTLADEINAKFNPTYGSFK